MTHARSGLIVAVLASALAPAAAHAGFQGNPLLIEWHFPNAGAVIASENGVVGPGIEFSERFGGPNIDVSDSLIDFFGADAVFFSSAPFNGFVFTDSSDAVDDIIGVSILSQVGYAGFDASDISFNANSIALNFESAGPIGDGNGVTLSVRFANAVAEPASLALLGFGLAGLGLSRRRKA